MDKDIEKIMEWIDKNTRFKSIGHSKGKNHINIVITKKSPLEK